MFNKVKTLGRTKSTKNKEETIEKTPGSGVALLVGNVGDNADVKEMMSGVAHCKVESCTTSDVRSKLARETYDVIMYDPAEDKTVATTVREAGKSNEKIFIVAYSPEYSDNAEKRLAAFDTGANMVSADKESVAKAIGQVISRPRGGSYTCPHCSVSDFSEDDLVAHMVLFHFNTQSEEEVSCPICSKGKYHKGNTHRSKLNIFVHMKKEHGKVARGEEPSESRAPTPVWPFALIVVRNSAGKFLVVQEYANTGYWLPAGQVNPAEDLQVAAGRIVKEQAGIAIELTGILRVSYTPQDQIARLRVLYLAKPTDESQSLKSVPDYDSLGAVWVDENEIEKVKLRGAEPRQWFPFVSKGGTVYSMDLMKGESAPVV